MDKQVVEEIIGLYRSFRLMLLGQRRDLAELDHVEYYLRFYANEYPKEYNQAIKNETH